MDRTITPKKLSQTLTPEEVEVLRQRFGLEENKEVNAPRTVVPTGGSDDEGGEGGGPAPAALHKE